MQRRLRICVKPCRPDIEAVLGKLKIVEEFPEGEIAITTFSDVGDQS